jgi:putative RNA 2'-phosphotransferase
MRNIYRCRVCGKYTESPVHCGVEAELFLDAKRRVMLSKLMSGLLRH